MIDGWAYELATIIFQAELIKIARP